MTKKGKSIKEAMQTSETRAMFKNPFLEKLTHVHPSVPFIVYIPIVVAVLYLSVTSGFYTADGQFDLWSLASKFLLGMLIWSISEYLIHRFVFHPPFQETYLNWFYFYVHGIHHDLPNDATRLVMPPLASLPLAILFYFLFQALFAQFALPYFAGFVTGYLIYDFLHFSTHFYNFSPEWYKKLRKHHIDHHFADPGSNFGISSTLWDYVFFTKLKRESKD